MTKRIFILLILLAFLAFIGLFWGRYPLSFQALFGADISKREVAIIVLWKIRLPRIVIAALGGAILSLAGFVFQTLFRNPLVSPDILGVSSGCSLGAVISLVTIGASPLLLQGAAFLSGLLCVAAAINLSRLLGRETLLGLIISGIVVTSIASSGIMFLKYFADPYKELPSIEFWLMGGLYNTQWKDILFILPVTFLASVILFLLSWPIAVSRLGDEQTKSLGINPVRLRYYALMMATLLVASIVSVAGLISWISLIAPHLARLYVKGMGIRMQMFITLLIGAALLMTADLFAKNLLLAELPVTILISFIGGPFLAFLLYQNKRHMRGGGY